MSSADGSCKEWEWIVELSNIKVISDLDKSHLGRVCGLKPFGVRFKQKWEEWN